MNAPQASTNIVWHLHSVSKDQRSQQKKQKPCLIWFTGLSGSGKSTLANALDCALYEQGYHCFLLDGDNVRHGLNKDLGFSDEARVENIRRIGEASKLFSDAGLITMSAFISPFASERQLVRDLFSENEFIEVHVSTPLNTCEERDPKGLYVKARKGEIANFTGIDSDYEIPKNPELTLDTSKLNVAECVEQLLGLLRERKIIK